MGAALTVPAFLFAILLGVGCDRPSSGAPDDRADTGSERSTDQKDSGDGGQYSRYEFSAYDSMLSRYSIDKDVCVWCYSDGIDSVDERRVVEVQREFAEMVVLRPIEAEAVRDSASAAASITRLVAALPSDSTSPLFGVPFTVRRAVQGTMVGSVTGSVTGDQPAHNYMVAVLVRRLPQEDRQLEEQFVVIAQQAVAGAKVTGASAPWQLVWHERDSGIEEQLTVTDPYALFRVRATGVPAVAFVRESATATRLVVVAADAEGVWRARWERVITPCAVLGER